MTVLRNNITNVLASDNRTTGFCTIFGVTDTNSRIISDTTVCNNAFGLFGIAVHGLNVGFAFISPATDRSRVRTTVRPGAGYVFNRAVSGPDLSVVSVRAFTGITRGGKVPLVVSGAFTAPVGYEPFRFKYSVIARSAAGCVRNRTSAVNNTVISDNGFS